MKIWNFLKKSMQKHGDKIAFCNGQITYNKLIKIVEDFASSDKYKLKLAYEYTKQEQAIQILQILASNNICVPITNAYGEKQLKEIISLTKQKNNCNEQTAFVMFTSGTTGTPKGVMLAHDNIIQNILAIESYFDVTSTQKILICRPLVHIAVLTGELLFGLYKGLQIHFYEQNFVAKRLASYIDENNVNILCCTPTIINLLTNYMQGNSLKSVVLSGEMLIESTAQKLKKYTNIDFYNVYGLTENSPRVSALLPSHFFDEIGSVGKAIANTEVKIIDNELCIKSSSVMQGFYNNEELTKQKIVDGYLKTGDIASVDNDGFITIHGRKDDLIIRAGLNIYPAQIQNSVSRLLNVEECLAYGEQDPNYGQKICLDVVTTLDKSTLRKSLLQVLDTHLMPSKINIVDKLEHTPSGKVKRHAR